MNRVTYAVAYAVGYIRGFIAGFMLSRRLRTAEAEVEEPEAEQ